MNSPRLVLLAEDDKNDVFFMTRAFQEAGMENPVQIARDGQEAIDYLSGAGGFSDRERHPFPSLVIMDLKMPRKTGMEVLAWLKEQPILKAVPVIILSSSSNRYDIEQAYQLSANAFLTKPISREERVILAKLVKDFWLSLNQPPAISALGPEKAKQFYRDPKVSPPAPG